jgi:ABC-2 type transport system ATP-binding protein
MISFRNVTKMYGAFCAVRGLSLEIGAGEFFCLLGPNGAGKTTLVRLTAGLAAPTEGDILLAGERPRGGSSRSRQRLGLVPQHSNLEAELTAAENLEYHGRLYGLPKAVRTERIAALLGFAGLTDRRDSRASELSGGMLRKLMIVKALMHRPGILLLDEPTAGLDAAWRGKIWDLLRGLRADGMTILMTTHYIEEAEALCSRAGLITAGVLRRTGAPADFIAAAGRFVVECFEGGATVRRFFGTAEEARDAARRLEEGTGAAGVAVREARFEDAYIELAGPAGLADAGRTVGKGVGSKDAGARV